MWRIYYVDCAPDDVYGLSKHKWNENHHVFLVHVPRSIATVHLCRLAARTDFTDFQFVGT